MKYLPHVDKYLTLKYKYKYYISGDYTDIMRTRQ